MHIILLLENVEIGNLFVPPMFDASKHKQPFFLRIKMCTKCETFFAETFF
jgi:hypothetical protein